MNKMNKALLVIVFGLLCVSFASAQSTWTYCDSSYPTYLTVSSVTLNPDPPVLGTNDTVTLTGTVTEAVTAGTVDLTITYYGFPVFSGSYLICDSNPCPQGPGDIVAAIVVSGSSLPPIAPPGNYVGTATVTDQSGNTLVCVNVDFTL